MLVLSRKAGQRILIGDQIAITIVRVSANSVRIGIEAPAGMTIMRDELRDEFAPREVLPLEAPDPAKPR